MVIKYKYSVLLLLEALLFTPIPLFFCIWFFFGHKGVDAAHPFMLIIVLSFILHTVSFWLFRLFVACQKLWEKDYLSIKGDHICFYDCLRRKYTEVTADEIEGINDYNYYFVPFIVQIIYTTKGRIFTLPALTNEGQERVTEIIYDFLYQAEKEKDERHTLKEDKYNLSTFRFLSLVKQNKCFRVSFTFETSNEQALIDSEPTLYRQ